MIAYKIGIHGSDVRMVLPIFIVMALLIQYTERFLAIRTIRLGCQGPTRLLCKLG